MYDSHFFNYLFHQIFKADVRIKNISTLGLVNGVDLRSIINESKEKINETLENLEERWKIIEQNIEDSSQISKTLPNIFFYLEEERDLKVPGTNVSKVNIVYLEDSITWNIYSEQPGRFCGLLDNCSCMYETATKSDVSNENITMRKRQVNPREIVKNFYDLDEKFSVSVMTTAVSSSKECTLTGTKPEYTTISLLKSDIFKVNQEDVIHFHKIKGYLKDAEIFKHDGMCSTLENLLLKL